MDGVGQQPIWWVVVVAVHLVKRQVSADFQINCEFNPPENWIHGIAACREAFNPKYVTKLWTFSVAPLAIRHLMKLSDLDNPLSLGRILPLGVLAP